MSLICFDVVFDRPVPGRHIGIPTDRTFTGATYLWEEEDYKSTLEAMQRGDTVAYPCTVDGGICMILVQMTLRTEQLEQKCEICPRKIHAWTTEGLFRKMLYHVQFHLDKATATARVELLGEP